MTTIKLSMVKELISIFLVLIAFNNSLSSQILTGSVCCSDTEELLPYPSIKIKNDSYHQVYKSYENGSFEIKIDNDSILQDTLILAYLGYKNKLVPVSELNGSDRHVFYLERDVFLLNQVDIVEDSEMKFLGKTKKQALIGWNGQDVKKGHEHRVLFRNNKKLELKKVFIPIWRCTYDTICARLNIYEIINMTEIKGRPTAKGQKFHEMNTKDVLKETIYFEFGKGDIENGYLYIDLEQFNAIVEGDFFVSLELVKDLGEGKIIFNARNKGRTYVRISNEKAWSSINIRAAMKLGVKEHSK